MARSVIINATRIFQGNATISWRSNAALAMIEETANAIAIEHCNSECVGATDDPRNY
jgi:hypothetical protein